jgi:hypothetical protein
LSRTIKDRNHVALSLPKSPHGILGVTFKDSLRASQHVSELLQGFSRSLYALRILKAHGLPPDALQEVARATSVARLLYAAPAWWGFTLGEDRVKLERMLNRMRRLGFLPVASPSMERLVAGADAGLLRADDHVLRGLFPPLAKTRYNLRPRRHPFVLPTKDTKNFIPRVLFAGDS